MKKQQNKEYVVQEWILKAECDDISSEALLSSKGGSPNTVCFLSQQMAEKYLKGYLVYAGRDFPKIHQLDRLVKLCKEIDEDFQNIKEECEYLSAFYVTTRYPGDYPDFDWKVAENAFSKAEKIKKFVLSKIGG